MLQRWAPAPSPRPGATSEEPASPLTSANAELLREVHMVVFGREPEDRSEFGSYVDSLNQGASLEGIYNGFTHSSLYREIEAAGPAASPGALRVFAEELALLEKELPEVTRFDASAAQPLAPSFPDPSQPAAVAGPVFPPERTSGEKADPRALADGYVALFRPASVFTLKRVIGDEALKVIGSKKQYRDRLSAWYGRWAARIARRGVDFGLELRNRPDEAFHRDWAARAPEDRIIWEVLNRLHRSLNAAAPDPARGG